MAFAVYCTRTRCLKSTPSGRKSCSGVSPMTTSNSSNRQTSSLDDAILNAMYAQSRAVASALFYPSLAGNSWDDELLPSGD